MERAGGQAQENPEGKTDDVLEVKTPHLLSYVWHTGLGLLSEYGWIILFAAVLIVIVWSVYIEPRLSEWTRRRNEQTMSAALHRDPDLARSHQEAMAAARLRMQERQNQMSAIYSERQQQREEEKRQEKITEYEKLKQGKGYFSKTKAEDKDLPDYSNLSSRTTERKPRLRDNGYNPLNGNSGSSYRAPPTPMFRGGG